MELESISMDGVTSTDPAWYDVPGLRLLEYEGNLVFEYLGHLVEAKVTKSHGGRTPGWAILKFETNGQMMLKGPQSLRVDLDGDEVGDPAKILEASVIAIRHLYLGFWYNYAEGVFQGIFRRGRGRGQSALSVKLTSMHARELNRPPMLCMEVVIGDDPANKVVVGKIV